MTDTYNVKLAIGTAHFGMGYGVYNKIVQPGKADISNIMEVSALNHIYLLDTAQSYGCSEEKLGEYDLTKFQIVTKISEGVGHHGIKELVFNSLNRLNIDKLYGVIYHNYSDYVSYPDSIKDLIDLKSKGLINKVGFSLYHTEHLDYILTNNLPIDIVQIPFSVFDQRFKEYFKTLKDNNIEIHTRSVYLQGLVFLNTNKLPMQFNLYKDRFVLLNEISKYHKIPIAALCLNFVNNYYEVDNIVIGVRNSKELIQNIRFIADYADVTREVDLSSISIDDENIILPKNWGLND